MHLCNKLELELPCPFIYLTCMATFYAAGAESSYRGRMASKTEIISPFQKTFADPVLVHLTLMI